MKKIGALISPLVKQLGIEEAVRLEEIRKKWDAVFSEPLSLHMYPSRLSNGELLVNVDSPLWLQQLTFLKPQIVKNLSSFGIKDVRFRIGRVSGARKEKGRALPPERTALKSDALQEIENTTSEMDDGEIKESIIKAMRRSLAAKKTK